MWNRCTLSGFWFFLDWVIYPFWGWIVVPWFNWTIKPVFGPIFGFLHSLTMSSAPEDGVNDLQPIEVIDAEL